MNLKNIKFVRDTRNGQLMIDPAQHDHLNKALTHFWQEPMRMQQNAGITTKQIQEFMTLGDFPANVREIIRQYQLVNAFDNGYLQIFDEIDMSGSQTDGFRIQVFGDGLTFSQTEVGEKAKLYQATGSEAYVLFNRYSGGMGWDRGLIEKGQYWTMEKQAISFRNKYFADKAARHYALIEAVAATEDITWQAPDPAALAVTDPVYTANRDMMTINAAIVQLLADLSGRGYTNVGIDGLNAEFVISCPVQLMRRVMNAVKLYLQSFINSPNQIPWNVRIIPTTMYAAIDQYYVIVPKNSLISANKMYPTIFTNFDMMTYTDAAVQWSEYVGVCGDIEQVKRCDIA